jgi:hypothetical protein
MLADIPSATGQCASPRSAPLARAKANVVPLTPFVVARLGPMEQLATDQAVAHLVHRRHHEKRGAISVPGARQHHETAIRRRNCEREHPETTARLTDGEEYLDLQHIDRGVLKACGVTLPMDRVLPRNAVQAATWTQILRRIPASKGG